MKKNIALLSLLVVTMLAGAGRGDIGFYRIPRTPLIFKLQGSFKVNPGRTVTFRHPKFGTLYFGLDDLQIHEVPSTAELFGRMLGKANVQKDAGRAMEAARWALHHGLLPQFYDACRAAYALDANHEDVVRVVALKRRIEQPIPESAEQEAYLRRLVQNPGMKIKRSNHFILMHDTPDTPVPPAKKPRADERLELLETVYESFLLKFYSQGVELELPRERLKVVLFNEQRDFHRFGTQLDPQLQSAAGFWDQTTNVSFFYDNGSSEQARVLAQISNLFQRDKERALQVVTPQTKHIVRMANTFELLVQISRENSDIEVVSHEATHQMAGNTGLLPRHVLVPSWIHEGLATYFESPNDAAWSGIGAVNKDRLEAYRELAPHREISNISFIVGDQIFTRARSLGATLHGYAQAWALTHFLMEEYFTEFMTFYRRLGEMPPDVILGPEVLNKLFDEVFGNRRAAMDAQWHSYMRTLRTDVEKVLDGT